MKRTQFKNEEKNTHTHTKLLKIQYKQANQ